MADTLSRDDVEDIAHLARLALDPDEIEPLRAELSAILEHMEALRTLDTEDVEPMTHAVPMAQRLREDEAGASLPVDEALAQAPDRSGEHFQVPNVIRPGGESS